MKKEQLKISGKNYSLRFDFTFQSLWAKANGFTKLSQLNVFFSQLDFSNGHSIEDIEAGKVPDSELEPTIDQLTILGDLVYYGIKSANPKFNLTNGEIVSHLVANPDDLKLVFGLFVDSQPKPSVNPETRGK